MHTLFCNVVPLFRLQLQLGKSYSFQLRTLSFLKSVIKVQNNICFSYLVRWILKRAENSSELSPYSSGVSGSGFSCCRVGTRSAQADELWVQMKCSMCIDLAKYWSVGLGRKNFYLDMQQTLYFIFKIGFEYSCEEKGKPLYICTNLYTVWYLVR